MTLRAPPSRALPTTVRGAAALALTIGWRGPDDGERREIVRLKRTRVGFGARWWCLCPGCGSRRSTLYLTTAAGAWRCRRCAQLGYLSHRLSRVERARYRRRQLAARLGAADGRPSKPLRMHWRTYARRLAALERADAALWGAVSRDLRRRARRHERLTRGAA
jgi:hypothetical protein